MSEGGEGERLMDAYTVPPILSGGKISTEYGVDDMEKMEQVECRRA